MGSRGVGPQRQELFRTSNRQPKETAGGGSGGGTGAPPVVFHLARRAVRPVDEGRGRDRGKVGVHRGQRGEGWVGRAGGTLSLALPEDDRREAGPTSTPSHLPGAGPTCPNLVGPASRRSTAHRCLVTSTCWHIERTGQVEHFGSCPVQMCLPKGTSKLLISIQ